VSDDSFRDLKTPPIHPVEKRIAIRFKDVSFSYGPVKVLEKVSFHIHQGEFIALVGPNGSGKTTVLKLLLGLEKPEAGTIELFGSSLLRGRDRVGYVPQQAPQDRAFPISVRDLVRMGRLRSLPVYGKEDRLAAEEALIRTGLLDLANRPFAALSGGQRRRVLVARALASRPEILILDEPTANMDRESGELLFETLEKLKGGATILMVTHDTDFVSSLTDRALCLGDAEGETHPYGMVQHPTGETRDTPGETQGPGGRGIPGFHGSRVFHGASLAADTCFGNGTGSGEEER
jgi:zinc transport system ATP-binding protein